MFQKWSYHLHLSSNLPGIVALDGGEQPGSVLLVVLANLGPVPEAGESVVDGLELLLRPVSQSVSLVVGIQGPAPLEELDEV